MYLRGKGLELSPSKTQGMIFCNKRRLALPDFPLMADGEPAKMVNTVRFLGVFLNAQLKDSAQLECLLRKGKVIIRIISSWTSTWRSSHPHLLLNLYKSLFRSAIEYGCYLLPLEKRGRLFLSLQRLQFAAVRKAMGYRRSTPINVMLYEARKTPP